MNVLIIASAPEGDISYIKELHQKLATPYVICADGGKHKADILGIRVDLWVGDFDSATFTQGVKAVILPTEKNFTDLEFAIVKALEQSPKKIAIAGALGGRADHGLCNMMLLFMPQLNDTRVTIYDGQNIVFKGQTMVINKVEGFKYLSILPIDQEVIGVNVVGVKYPLHGVTLLRHQSLSISNEIVEGSAKLEIGGGASLIILSKDF